MCASSSLLESRPGGKTSAAFAGWRTLKRAAAYGLLLALTVGLAGCTSVPPREHQSLTAGAEPLRSEFNRDAGNTRIVILLAPT